MKNFRIYWGGKMKKRLISLLLMLAMSMSFISAQDVFVEVAKNTINVTLNGSVVEADNLLYEGRTYIQLRKVSEMIGANLTWDQSTKTADLQLDQNVELTTSKTIYSTDYNNPVIDFSTLEVDKKDIDGLVTKNDGQDILLGITDEGIKINGLINRNSTIEFSIIKKDGSVMSYNLQHTSDPEIDKTDYKKTYFIAADPAKGFNFPYLVYVPDNYFYKDVEKTEKNYIIVDTVNNGSEKSMEVTINDAVNSVMRGSLATYPATALQTPLIVPLFTRSGTYNKMDGFGYSSVYEHALDRDTVYIRELVEEDSNAYQNKINFSQKNIDPSLYYDFDDQIAAMLTHAVDLLNDNGFKVEDKVIMYGYSASGSFAERFTALHPEKVAMLFAGANNDNLLFPTDTYKGETLNYPLGTGDYKDITGREFDLNTFNSIPRIYYMGKDDTNDVVGYTDCFYTKTNDQYNRLFSSNVLKRAYESEKLFGDVGGKGMFILDQGIAHGMSQEVREYMIDFIIANSKSDTPIYPIPEDSRLEYTIFK